MNYNRVTVLFSICLTIFTICFAVVLTVNFRWLYYFDISYLNIEGLTSYSYEVIKNNYDILIDYQSIFYQGDLVFNDFVMSTNGQIHFAEVKNIFVMMQALLAITGVGLFPMFYLSYKNRNFMFLKLTNIILISIFLIAGISMTMGFNRLFILFHQVVFSNDYWIFNPIYDPIITILPEQFFMHSFLLILFIICGLMISYYLLFRKTKKLIT